MGPTQPCPHFAAPWSLNGEGFILIYKFQKNWVEQHACITSDQQGKFQGGLGYVMLVNYMTSPVGPYKELLMIPGKFYPHRRQSISRIFVDVSASTENGRFNWGIPKETKPFAWQSERNSDTIVVGEDAAPIFRCEIRSGGPTFPVTTRLLPIRLHQELEGATYRTNPSGWGWARFCRIESLKIDAQQFPDISRLRPLACMKVSPFRLHFPKAE